MYRCWWKGGGDRAWLVIWSVFICSPDKGFWICLWDLLTDMPRRSETWVSLCKLMLKLAFCTTPLSSGRIVPRVTIAGVTLFIPRERPNVQHSIGYSRLPQPSPAPALMRELHLHCCWAKEPGYATGNSPVDYGQIWGGCSFPLMIAVTGTWW